MTYEILEELEIDIINPKYKKKYPNEKEFKFYSLDSTDDVDLEEQEEEKEEEE